tara:strand:+ start:45 stop:923 length:879 start_codon:yes stop_codon:yes gene_type:complete
MAIDKAIAKAILGNGKRAVKNGVKNGVNSNGVKNGVNGHLAKTQYVESQLSKQGMRKNLKAFGYRQREMKPDITPKEITQKYDNDFGIGARTWQGEEQMFVSGGSTPTKKTDISIEGQRPLQLQDKSKNQARKRKNIQTRAEHGYTSPQAKQRYHDLSAMVALENKATKEGGGKFVASIEHDVAISGGRQWWNKVGNKANDNENLFVARDHYAREFKNNYEYWFYNWVKKKGNNWVIKTDRSNMKDLEILEVSTGKILGVIPMPKNYTSGVPADLKANLLDMLKSNAEGFKP